jgi:hypothetical protein
MTGTPKLLCAMADMSASTAAGSTVGAKSAGVTVERGMSGSGLRRRDISSTVVDQGAEAELASL